MSRKLVTGQMPSKPKEGSDPGGRPAIIHIHPEKKEKLLNALRIGAHLTTAATLNSISYATLRNWVVLGRQNPESEYGALLVEIEKAISEWEVMDLSVIETHAKGRPAQYEMEIERDEDGAIVRDDKGRPMMRVARDSHGNPIVKVPAIKSDWKASMERLSRRNHRHWARRDQLPSAAETDPVLTFDNKQPETKETVSFEQSVANEIKRLEEEV